MIEKFLVSELDTIAELNHQLYPVAAPVGELEGSFCIYTRVSGEIQRDLMNEPVYYRDVYRLDLYNEDTDTLFALEKTVINHLTKNNVEFEELYIFDAVAVPGAPDGFDLTMEINQRSIAYTVTYWR